MSFDRFAWERLAQASDLPFGPRALLMHLAVFADVDGLCHPGGETLARAAGVDRRAITNWLKVLRETGWIHSRRTGSSNRYVLTVPSKAPAMGTTFPTVGNHVPSAKPSDGNHVPNRWEPRSH